MDYGSVLRELTELDHWLEGVAPEPLTQLVEKLPLSSSIPIYLCLVSLFLLSFVVFVFKRRNSNRLNCKWRKSINQTVGSLTQFECKVCGVEAFTANGKPPKDCKRGLKVRPL